MLGNEPERASALAGEALSLGRTLEDTGGVARALLVLGLAAVVRGDHERAGSLYEESLALSREAGDDLATVLALGMGALASLGQGDIRLAGALCEEGLANAPQPRVMNVTAFQLQTSAALAHSRGDPARAGRLWGAAESLREAIGARLSPVEVRAFLPYVEAARGAIGDAAWNEARAEGRAMTVEQATVHALDQKGERRTFTRRPPAQKRPSGAKRPKPGLTRREREVALLLARGLTNRQIAVELTISERTVTTHVGRILRKLGAASRSRLAAWAVEHRLLPEKSSG